MLLGAFRTGKPQIKKYLSRGVCGFQQETVWEVLACLTLTSGQRVKLPEALSGFSSL